MFPWEPHDSATHMCVGREAIFRLGSASLSACLDPAFGLLGTVEPGASVSPLIRGHSEASSTSFLGSCE